MIKLFQYISKLFAHIFIQFPNIFKEYQHIISKIIFNKERRNSASYCM